MRRSPTRSGSASGKYSASRYPYAIHHSAPPLRTGAASSNAANGARRASRSVAPPTPQLRGERDAGHRRAARQPPASRGDLRDPRRVPDGKPGGTPREWRRGVGGSHREPFGAERQALERVTVGRERGVGSATG